MQGILDFFLRLFTGRRRVPVGGDHPRKPQTTPKPGAPKPVVKPRTPAARPATPPAPMPAPAPVQPAPSATPLEPTPEAAPLEPVAPVPAPEPAPATHFLDTLVAKSRDLIGDADYDRAAGDLGCESAAVEAVARVESGRFGPFDAQTGRAIILFEPHIFSQRTKRAFDKSNPRVSYQPWNPRAYPRTQMERWEQLREAYDLDDDVGLMSASYGRFQIMGFNFAACGYATVFDYVKDVSTSDARQLAAFVGFIKSNPALLKAIRAKDWRNFALGYNGSGALNPGQEYDRKIAEAYAAARTRRGVV